jgi:Zn ribbon nucleic-acid-binding protein
MKKACDFYVGWDRRPGDTCPECQHSDLLHPGFMNPGLEECALCAVQIALDEFPKRLKRAVKQQAKQRG